MSEMKPGKAASAAARIRKRAIARQVKAAKAEKAARRARRARSQARKDRQ